MIALVVVAVVALRIANHVRRDLAEMSEFREEHSEAKILGKTADEIIVMYGKPYGGIQRDDAGVPATIVYRQEKYPQYCGIGIKDGRAIRVSFSGQ